MAPTARPILPIFARSALQPLHSPYMTLLEKLADIFFDTFGITKPADQARSRAAWFLFTMMVLVLGVLVGVSILLYHLLHV